MLNNEKKADIGILLGDANIDAFKQTNPNIQMWVVIGSSLDKSENKVARVNSKEDIDQKISYVKDLQYKQFELFDPLMQKEKYRELIVYFSQKVIELKKQNIIIDNTKVINSRKNITNIIKNFNRNSKLNLLSGLALSNNKHCLCIAAGPSLELDIKTIKQNRDKLFIICCDAALSVCINHDIIPDLITAVEANDVQWDLFFKNIDPMLLKDTRLVLSPWADFNLYKNYPGEFIIFDTDFPESFFWNHLKNSLYLGNKNYNLITLNVGFFNVSLAYLLDFKNILLTGFDLSFPDNKSHSLGVAHRRENTEEINNYKSCKKVASNDGKENSINQIFLFYKENFETYAGFIKNNIINCSQRGAILANTTFFKLNNYINEHQIEKPTITLTKQVTIKQKKVQKIIEKLISSLDRLHKLCASNKELDVVMSEMRNYKKETDILANYEHKLMLYAKQHINNQKKDPDFRKNLREILKITSKDMSDFLKTQINL